MCLCVWSSTTVVLRFDSIYGHIGHEQSEQIKFTLGVQEKYFKKTSEYPVYDDAQRNRTLQLRPKLEMLNGKLLVFISNQTRLNTASKAFRIDHIAQHDWQIPF